MQISFDSYRIVSLLPPFYHSVSYEGCNSYLQNMVLRPMPWSFAHHTEEKRKCIQSTRIWKQIGRLGGLDLENIEYL